MLFRATIALFVLFNTLPAPSFAAGKETASEITVVGPTDNSAAFIAVRPAATPMQPEVSPVQVMTAKTSPQPAAEETETPAEIRPVQAMTAETSPQPAAEEPESQAEIRPVQTMTAETSPQPAAEEPETQAEIRPVQAMTAETTPQPATAEPETQAEIRPVQAMTTETSPQPAAEEPETMTGRGAEMIAGMPVSAGGEQTQMQRPLVERLQDMLGEPTLTKGDREMLRGVIMRMRGRRLQRRAATQETMKAMEPTPMERTTMERPMTTPETEQVTPMMVPGARFNTAVGDVELTREMLEGSRNSPETAIRDMEFNTFVGRLRGPGTERGRGQEPQWEQVWMPRGRWARGMGY